MKLRILLAASLIVMSGTFVHAETFNPQTVVRGGHVSLTGKAKPLSPMSAYFYCTSGCGQTRLGVAYANSSGNYSLDFTVPITAKPGNAYVMIGCDKCGNGWLKVLGLQVMEDRFSSVNVMPGDTLTLTGKAKSQSPMSAYFFCEPACGQTHLGVATADAGGNYSLVFKVPTSSWGQARVTIGCDSCGNGWRRVAGLQVNNGFGPGQPINNGAITNAPPTNTFVDPGKGVPHCVGSNANPC